MRDNNLVVAVTFKDIGLGQNFEFQGIRYKKVALSMAVDEANWGNVFNSETEVRPGAIDPAYVSVQLRGRGQAAA